MLWRSAPASPCGPLPPAPFSRTLCCRPVPAIELSSCRPGLSAPAWKEYARKNPQEAILDRPAQGCRKKAYPPQKRRPRNRQGSFRPPPDQGCRKEAYLLLGRHPENRPPFLLFQFCSGTRTGIRSFGRGFDGSGRSLRSSGIRLRSILRGFWIRSTRFRSQ